MAGFSQLALREKRKAFVCEPFRKKRRSSIELRSLRVGIVKGS